LQAGALDHRLINLPSLYLQLINEKELLLNDGLLTAEIYDLYELHSKLIEQCRLLAQYKIPETIEHGDFHDNNILIQGEKISIHDWGEVTITHPFFSLASCLYMATYPSIHNLQENGEKYLTLQNCYLKNWIEYAPMNKLVEAFLLIKKLRHFQFVLGFSRIKMCKGMDELPRYNGCIAKPLRKFIEVFKNDL
jgi:hypothetical protein